jgi:endonuclease/exonuclease/phosphatase family metal-dependent hydrolase
MDGKLSPRRIARVVRQCRADVVALQELDVGRQRTGEVDQAQAIAHLLEMDFHFHPAWELEEGRYGNAILSRFPMDVVRKEALPGYPRRPNAEPRGALCVELNVGDKQFRLINTHLGLARTERLLQVEALLGPLWLAHSDCPQSTTLCGDFNATPSSAVYARICQILDDAQRRPKDFRPRATWFSGRPINRIDHVFISPDMEVRSIEVPFTDLARIASDHLPLVVELELAPTNTADPNQSFGQHR